jgi:hypothetical protein
MRLNLHVCVSVCVSMGVRSRMPLGWLEVWGGSGRYHGKSSAQHFFCVCYIYPRSLLHSTLSMLSLTARRVWFRS